MEYVIRFFLGGLIVTAFALISDLLRPKNQKIPPFVICPLICIINLETHALSL